MQTLEPFLSSVKKSGLLDPHQVDEEVRALTEDRPLELEEVAAHFIERGLLTGFQARKLIAGRTRGLVLGPFHLLAPLGRGGMSAVYLARDTRCDEYRAVKVLPPHKVIERTQLLTRFQREMQLSRLIDHPNLVRSTDVGEERGVYYIAMEYLPGLTITRIVTDHGPLPVGRAAVIFAGVCDGLSAAHARGLIHRDLKPSNIIVCRNDQAKVLDLGLALLEQEADAERSMFGGRAPVVGTMDYIAPEQSRDAARVDGRADLYSLGCSLFYSLAGQPPFPGGTPRERIRRHRTEEPRKLTALNPNVPAEVAALVRRLLEKDPSRRPASAEEVRDELLRWPDSPTTSASSVPPSVMPDGSDDNSVAQILRARDVDDAVVENDWKLFYPSPSVDGDETETAIVQALRQLRALPLVPLLMAVGVGVVIGLILTTAIAILLLARHH